MRTGRIALAIAAVLGGAAGVASAAALSQGYTPSGEVTMSGLTPAARATFEREGPPPDRIEKFTTKGGNTMYQAEQPNGRLMVTARGEVVQRTR
jgi:hypothetical protein